MSKEEIAAEIKAAFRDVELDGGVGIRQALVHDNYGRGFTQKEYAAFGHEDARDDWRALDAKLLEQYDIIAHLDAKGFCFYIPAYLLAALNSPDWPSYSDPDVIFPLDARRSKGHREWALARFEPLTTPQRTAIAHFLQFFVESTTPDNYDHNGARRILEDFWHAYL